MTLKLAIWDVDGTLVDSRQAISRAMGRAFEALGQPDPGYERTRTIVGLSLDEACRRLAPDHFDDADVQRLTHAYKHAFVLGRADADYAEPLYDGALDSVRALREAGWLLGVATGKARAGLDKFFERHPEFGRFDVVRCADDGPGKPAPFMVLDALRVLGVTPSAAVMIGDTSHDIAMARAARVRALGVTWGFHTAEEIAEAGAHEVHDRFDTLNAALAAFEPGAPAEVAP